MSRWVSGVLIILLLAGIGLVGWVLLDEPETKIERIARFFGAKTMTPPADAPEQSPEVQINGNKNENSNTNDSLEKTLPQEEPTPSVAMPTDGFKDRITKKPFGIYITPENSPVQPERFTGYHTADDVEFADVEGDVPVYAFADGTVLRATTVSGYGGVLVIQHALDGEDLLSLYGHVDVQSLPPVGTAVRRGQQVAVLGEGYTSETDGERQHLHFGIIKGTVVNYRGYVSTEAALSAWRDPLSFFP